MCTALAPIGVAAPEPKAAWQQHDLSDDGPRLPLAKAENFKVLRRGRRKPSRTTVWWWATRGVKGIRLETVMQPSGLATTEALQSCRAMGYVAVPLSRFPA